MAGTLTITSYEQPGGLVVTLRGPLDSATTHQLDRVIDLLMSSPPAGGLVVFDCSEVPLMGSLAMGAFIRLRRAYTKTGQTIRLSTLDPTVHGALKHARLHQFFEIYDTVEGALGQIVG